MQGEKDLVVHVAHKPVPNMVSFELAWKLPALNALNRFRNRLANQYANYFQGLVGSQLQCGLGMYVVSACPMSVQLHYNDLMQ